MRMITVEMPAVARCAVSNCAYNLEKKCHAKAITVGNTINPECDTYFSSQQHSQDKERIAGVGACKVASCRHNEDFECTAEQIDVGLEGDSVHCLTFEPEQN